MQFYDNNFCLRMLIVGKTHVFLVKIFFFGKQIFFGIEGRTWMLGLVKNVTVWPSNECLYFNRRFSKFWQENVCFSYYTYYHGILFNIFLYNIYEDCSKKNFTFQKKSPLAKIHVFFLWYHFSTHAEKSSKWRRN